MTDPKKLLKVGAIAVLAIGGTIILALVARSYFLEGSGNRNPKISEVITSGLIATTSQGVFIDKSVEVRSDVVAPWLGNSAPDFELRDFAGNTRKLSDYKGKPVLLNFWATWCPPCRKEMPDLQKFFAEYGDRIEILGINWNDDPSAARELLNEAGTTYVNLIDEIGRAFVLYRLTAVPTSFWIDEQGVIRGIWNGAMDHDTLVAGFQKTTSALDDHGDL